MAPPNSPDSDARTDTAADLKLVDSSATSTDPAAETRTADPAGEADADFAPTPGEGAAGEPTPGEGGSRGLPIWLFLLVFVAFALALSWQLREGWRLESQVAELEQELGQTRSLLRAHQGHLSEIRSGVHAMADRFDALRALVDSGPGESASMTSRPSPGTEGMGAISGDPSPSIPARLPER